MTDSTEVARPGTSLVQIKIGNREYPMVQSSRCGVCMHPGRFAIEEKLMLNFGYPAIIKYVSDQEVMKDDGTVEHWPEISTMQIRHHRDAGHIALNSEMIKEITQRRAEAQGIDLENYTGQFVDHVVAQKIILQQGVEALIKGELKPDVKDVLAASKLLTDLEAANEAHASVEQFQELMVLYFRTVQRYVTRDQWQEIIGEISSNPVFKAIQQKRTIEG